LYLTERQIGAILSKQYLTFRESGCPENVLECILHSAQSISGIAVSLEFNGDPLPIMIVPGSDLISTSDLLRMIRGIEYIETDFIKDDVKIPETGFYFLIDIENGRSNIGKSPKKVRDLLMGATARSLLTLREIIMLCMFSPQLTHGFWASNSSVFYNEGGCKVTTIEVPYIAEIGAGRKCLDTSPSNDDNHRLGSPSCARRLPAFPEIKTI